MAPYCYKRSNYYFNNFINLQYGPKKRNKMQNIDFNNPTKEVIFELCMGDITIPYGNYEDFEIPINREDHRDILVRYDFQSYSDTLIEYQKKWFSRRDSMARLKIEVFDGYFEGLKYKLRVSKILKMFLAAESNNKSKIGVSFTDLYNKINLTDINLKELIKETIIKEFENLKLNETECTRDEALEEIITVEDPEWLSEYAFGDCFDGYRVNLDFVTEEIIENYIFSHYKPREVDLELINNVITELETSLNERKGKAGAKIKNMNIGELAKKLSLFHRFQKFLHQNNYSSIKDYPLSNNTCRFIYEYFDFWGLLYDHVKFDKSESDKRAKYIRSLIRNSVIFSERGLTDYEKMYKIMDVNLESRIDLFKRTKEGLLTPEDFYMRMSSMQP